MNNNSDSFNKKQVKIHKENYLMYEKTLGEIREKLSEALNSDGSRKYDDDYIQEKVNRIKEMQDEVKNKFLLAGGNLDDLLTPSVEVKTKKQITPKKQNKKPVELVNRPPISKREKKENIVMNPTEEVNMKEEITNTQPTAIVPSNWERMDFNDSFDVIPLPSKGECYENGMKNIAVSYLTANDENMIVSPNLYRDGMILDYLLRAKIKNTEINPDDLLEGDREAIILWLRATSYGIHYPITVTDNKTGIDFDTVIDLTQIKHKPFTLEGDGDGCFDFILPTSNDKVKFRFLTHGDIKQIEEIEKEEQVNVKKEQLLNMVDELNAFLENDDILNKDEKTKLFEAKRNIKKWADKLNVDDDLGYTHKLTNKLELSVVSINGETNREYIANYVQNMNVRDALALRKYISENEPGLDYTVTVERPESLGGGSMPVFLSLDEYVFLNIA